MYCKHHYVVGIHASLFLTLVEFRATVYRLMHTLWEENRGLTNCLLHPTWIWFLSGDNYENYVFQNQNMYYIQISLHYRHPCQLIPYTCRIPGYTVKAYAYTMRRKWGTYELFIAPYMDLVSVCG